MTKNSVSEEAASETASCADRPVRSDVAASRAPNVTRVPDTAAAGLPQAAGRPETPTVTLRRSLYRR